MAASNDSNDASDIFWPGYVDAISNLAINLLFVIAVMSIVVIGATLQISELNKRKDRAIADDVSFSAKETKETLKGSGNSASKSNTNADSQLQNPNSSGNDVKASEGVTKSSLGQNDKQVTVPESKLGAASMTSTQAGQKDKDLQNLTDQNKSSKGKSDASSKKNEANMKALQEQIDVLQLQLKIAQSQLSEAKAASLKAQAASGASAKKLDGVKGAEAESSRVETAQNSQIKTTEAEGSGSVLAVNGGVIVPFDSNVIELTPAIVPSIIEKMATFAEVKSSKWRITVIVPNGFSEAKRIGFYRANAVRNALLRNGVKGENLEVQIRESSDPSADNSRIIIRTAK